MVPVATTLPPHGEPIRPLTRRQEEIVELLPFGYSLAEIGARLVPPITEESVGNHIDRISQLLDNEGELPAEKHVRAWAGWRFWRRHFHRHPHSGDLGCPGAAIKA